MESRRQHRHRSGQEPEGYGSLGPAASSTRIDILESFWRADNDRPRDGPSSSDSDLFSLASADNRQTVFEEHDHEQQHQGPSASSSGEEGSADSGLAKSSSTTSSESMEMRSAMGASMSNSSFRSQNIDNDAIIASVVAQSLEVSISRKQGWLPFPPARLAGPEDPDLLDDSDDAILNFPSLVESRDEPQNHGRHFYGAKRSTSSSNCEFSSSADNNSSSDSQSSQIPAPRTDSYEIKVKQLCFKLPAKSESLPSKLKKLLSRCSFSSQRRKNEGDENMNKDGHSSVASDDRCILRNISFDAKPGQVLAIAGASGAGKSTILECLAGRITPSSPPECIQVNDKIMHPSTFRRISAYVMQDDALFPTLTVFETLLISARLRLPSSMPRAEKLLRVHSLISELGLKHAANRRIGDELKRGISGGERRRVSIGVDVIHDPAVLLLDEPTSGLDSAAALNVIAMLRGMAIYRGRTVILSIHQPSFRLLQHMHSILLVAGGIVVHHGSVGLLASRLENAGHRVPARTTVLEYAIDAINAWVNEDLLGRNYAVMAEGIAAQQQLLTGKSLKTSTTEHISSTYVDLEKGGFMIPSSVMVEEHEGSDAARKSLDHGDDKKISYSNNVVEETMILTERFFKNILRTKELFFARSLQSLLCGILLGTIFLKSDDDRQGVRDRIGFLVFTISYLLNSTMEALPIFLQERQILVRETSRGAYRVLSYVLSQAVVFVPFLLVNATLYATPSYWITGLDPVASEFAYYILALWGTLLLANSFVALCSALVPNYILGQGLASALMGVFFVGSGYIISRDNIPTYWIWIHYISLFKYPLEGLLLNEFGQHREKCYESIGTPPAQMCLLNGSQVLKESGVQGDRKWVDLAIMGGFILFYRITCYFAVRWRLSRPNR